ncbi:xylulokinase [Roseobacter denitrificans]|uniref:Xylulose kinase n=1 Tax=Roseobacter denitrificans (strain ATCC 33942 / OCh 114) TaxID=375451 RepID=Q162B7_ROSDO|nr:xylulokinase [Roseobacter denitrificans]ABG33176.1 xylulose kinase [Roseobacter denitrificans OCh 114]AVL52530.1 xylulokinase [Roseobacter denitrificans]SFG29467.1 xylulokinase [Roseobacter denitrificans OCh 114]
MTFIGLDLGTSSLKAILMDAQQNILSEHAVPLSVERRQDGWSEQDPQSWCDAAIEALSALAAHPACGEVMGIGLSGHMHGATLIGADDAPLRPCMLWNDTRSHVEAAGMDADPQFRDISGNIVFPGFTAPKVEWVRRNEPHVFDQTAKVLLPKDYLRRFLTGEYFSEMSDAAGTAWFDTGKRDWSDALLSECGLTRAQMPALVEGSTPSGTLRKDLAAQTGVPQCTVAGGAGDNAAAAIGAGVVTEGSAFLSLGTSGVLFAANAGYRPAPSSAVHTFCHALPDTWHQMGVILAATDALEWLARLTGQSAAALTRDLGVVRAPEKTLFLPYLGGERTPHNDAQIRGQFLHLDHATDAKAAARAVLQGVSFAFADCKDALSATGTKVTRALALGGGAKSDHWVAMLATTLNITLDVPRDGDFGAALGAARLAMMASTGGGADIASQPPISRSVDPDPALHAAMADAHARYNHAYTLLKDL